MREAANEYYRILVGNQLKNRETNKMKLGWEVDETGSGSCPMTGFGISGVEPSCSATGEFVHFQVPVLKKYCKSHSVWCDCSQVVLLTN
jgi:hypothetical protein